MAGIEAGVASDGERLEVDEGVAVGQSVGGVGLGLGGDGRTPMCDEIIQFERRCAVLASGCQPVGQLIQVGVVAFSRFRNGAGGGGAQQQFAQAVERKFEGVDVEVAAGLDDVGDARHTCRGVKLGVGGVQRQRVGEDALAVVVGKRRIRHVREELVFDVDIDDERDLGAQTRDGRGAGIGFDVEDFGRIDRGGDAELVENPCGYAPSESVDTRGIVEVGLADVGAKIRLQADSKVTTERVAADGKAGRKRTVVQPRLHLGLERDVLQVELHGQTHGKIDVGADVVQPTGSAYG